MGSHALSLSVLLLIFASVAQARSFAVNLEAPWVKPAVYNYTTLNFTQKLDHFNYGVQSKTFQQKYLINKDHFNGSNGPIFFYAGNEGAIELFAQNTGFMFEIAPKFGAMLVFAEHRYYGATQPFGNQSYTHKQYYQYQSSMQALADYVDLLAHLKSTIPGASKSPVIVFGGSYGGMLAAWFRIKYPHIVQGAIAASAPVAQFTGLTPCEDFGALVTNVYKNASKGCDEIVRRSWKAIDEVTVDDDGKAWLTSNWKLCDPIKSDSDVKELKAYLDDLWINMAMVNYPYPSNFLAPLPAFPIKETCAAMPKTPNAPKELLLELFKGISVYFNTSTTADCLQYKAGAQPVSLGAFGWYLQSCTEMVMPMCFNNKDDMFEPAPWNLTEFKADCAKKWGTTPEEYKMEHIYGGRSLAGASNIVFSNGLLDPWSTGGVLQDQSDTVIAVIIPEGAHHLDLRASVPEADPASVKTARSIHQKNIARWITQYWEDRK